MLFKDEVRRVGAGIGIDTELLVAVILFRPGLGIRILGDITAEKVRMLQEVDAIFINGLKSGIFMIRFGRQVQRPSIVLVLWVMNEPMKSALRCAVQSTDGMTADWVDLPYAFLQEFH